MVIKEIIEIRNSFLDIINIIHINQPFFCLPHDSTLLHTFTFFYLIFSSFVFIVRVDSKLAKKSFEVENKNNNKNHF
jgi:hypothetical protein